MDLNLLKKVCNTPGVSGHEEPVQQVVAEHMRGCCDQIHEDRMGNIIGIRRATAPVPGERPLRVILAAHVDEFGFLVTKINNDGFIKVSIISGADAAMLMGQQIVIHGKEDVLGVIAPKPGKEIKLSDLWIDTGQPKDWVDERVSVGDIATLNIKLTALNDGVVVARNFDDRLGTYCMLKALEEIGELRVDLYCVSTVQEEVGVRGMPVAAAVIDPDMGLAIDGGCSLNPYDRDKHCDLGTGVAIYVKDRLTFGSKKLLNFLYEICDADEIPYAKTYDGGTDASALQRTGSGALTTTVGAPTRYMHTAVQMANTEDIDATTMLLRRFAETAHELLPDCNPWRALK